uniref:Uncharacterized protein n=1 Tax=Nelumbo nucifera TaxID=4432 RepID=A0A822YWZ4_NELNU|nr:TPA_asm: hypothetical protein HUJ06_012916 [Nelumbo nucifera]
MKLGVSEFFSVKYRALVFIWGLLTTETSFLLWVYAALGLEKRNVLLI